MANRTTFICLLRPVRAGFIEQMLPEEATAMKDHGAYLDQLMEQTTFYLIGPCLDRTYGVTIFEAESLEAAQHMVAHDPTIERGIMTAEIHPFHISYLHPAEA